MKRNWFRLIGIVAVVAAIGFSVASCSNDGSSTFQGAGFQISVSNFNSVMAGLGKADVGYEGLIGLSRADGETVFEALEAYAFGFEGDTGLSLSDIRGWLRDEIGLPSDDVSVIVDTLSRR